MPNRLDLPPELSSLIEKREKEDRRNQESDAQAKSAEDNTKQAAPAEDRRKGNDRRTNES